jgi:hypothetical protein
MRTVVTVHMLSLLCPNMGTRSLIAQHAQEDR